MNISRQMKSKIIAICLIGTFASEAAFCTNPTVLFLVGLAMIGIGISPNLGDSEHYGPGSCGGSKIVCVDSCKPGRIETYHFANDTSECKKNGCVRGAVCIEEGKEVNARNAFHPEQPYLGTTWGWALTKGGGVLAVIAFVWSWAVLAKSCYELPDYLNTHKLVYLPNSGALFDLWLVPRGSPT